jgi:hypothetical protein
MVKRTILITTGMEFKRHFLIMEMITALVIKAEDLGYSANLFYFPNKGIIHVFFVNYGTDADSGLKQVFFDFQEELLNLTLS